MAPLVVPLGGKWWGQHVGWCREHVGTMANEGTNHGAAPRHQGSLGMAPEGQGILGLAAGLPGHRHLTLICRVCRGSQPLPPMAWLHWEGGGGQPLQQKPSVKPHIKRPLQNMLVQWINRACLGARVQAGMEVYNLFSGLVRQEGLSRLENARQS